jgi:hypothetical protein
VLDDVLEVVGEAVAIQGEPLIVIHLHSMDQYVVSARETLFVHNG